MYSEDGTIAIALISLVVFSIVAGAFLSVEFASINITQHNYDSIKAFYIAQAGLADAVRYEEDVSFSKEFNGGRYDCKVEVGKNGSKVIKTIGIFMDARRGVEARVIKVEDMYQITGWLET